MFKRNTKFLSAVFASFLAAAALATMSCSTARAAEECLAGPKAHAPQRGHWYYYIDHPTKRHCWYLGEERGKLSRTASPNSSPAATPESQPDLQTAEAAMQPSLANARAELPAQSTLEQPNQSNAPAPANTAIWENGAPAAQTQRSIVASRWPDGSEPISQVIPAPDKSDPASDENSTAPTQPPSPTVAQVATANLSSEALAYSMPMQLAALMGALAIAGIIGSVVFKFSPRRPAQVQVDARRPDFSRAVYDADDRDERITEFFAQLSRRPPR